MKQKILWGIAVVALLLAGFAVFARPNPINLALGAAGGMLVENYDAYNRYNDGYKSENEIVLSGADGDITTGDDLIVADDITISGGSLAVTTTNAATSTVSVGCVQTVATSTATPIAQTYLAVATATTNMVGGQTNNGFVVWKYGSCPF